MQSQGRSRLAASNYRHSCQATASDDRLLGSGAWESEDASPSHHVADAVRGSLRDKFRGPSNAFLMRVTEPLTRVALCSTTVGKIILARWRVHVIRRPANRLATVEAA